MPRMLDLYCTRCGEIVLDKFFMSVPDIIQHEPTTCGGGMQHYLMPKSARRPAQWSDRDAVVVFRDGNGQIRYPGRNDLPTPPGCERVVMRSLREVEAFEKRYNVKSEMAWFDKGSGRSFDEGDGSSRRTTEAERFNNFMKSYRS